MTRGRDGGARGCPTFGKGGPRVPAGGRGNGVGSLYRPSSAGQLPPVVGEYPMVVEGRNEVIPGRAGVSARGGVVMYVWRRGVWGTIASHRQPSAVSRWTRASRVPSATTSTPP